MSEAYGKFAEIYDALMYDVDYEGLADYFEALIGRHTSGGNKVRTILDAGCGTGSTAHLLAARGYDVCGIDLSGDMIAAAKKKCVGSGNEFYRCDMADEDGIGQVCGRTFDAAVSFFDCINYITEKDRLARAFANIYEVLEPGGIFVFDINSPHKLRDTLGNNFFYDIGDDECCLWENSYDAEADTVRFDLTFFARDKASGMYARTDEVHYEKVYEPDVLTEMLKNCGFEAVTVYGDRSFAPPDRDGERFFLTGRKKHANR